MSKVTQDDWILYYSNLWLEEEINSRGYKNVHELYYNTLINSENNPES